MISPPCCSASASPRALLPDAVGPRIARTRGRTSRELVGHRLDVRTRASKQISKRSRDGPIEALRVDLHVAQPPQRFGRVMAQVPDQVSSRDAQRDKMAVHPSAHGMVETAVAISLVGAV